MGTRWEKHDLTGDGVEHHLAEMGTVGVGVVVQGDVIEPLGGKREWLSIECGMGYAEDEIFGLGREAFETRKQSCAD